MNVGKYIDDAVERFKDHTYMQFYDETITYNGLKQKVNILANALKKQGFKKGDFIHVLVQNSPETLMSYMAILKIGCVAGPINGWWKGPEIEYLLNDSKGCGLIIQDQYMPILEEIKDKCTHLEKVIQVDGEIAPGNIDFSDLLADGVRGGHSA